MPFDEQPDQHKISKSNHHELAKPRAKFTTRLTSPPTLRHHDLVVRQRTEEMAVQEARIDAALRDLYVGCFVRRTASPH